VQSMRRPSQNTDTFPRSAPEMWAVDYDTVVRVDRRSWVVTGTFLGQQPTTSGVRMFVGDLWFTGDEQLALVPRPGSGDVLTLHTSSLEVVDRFETGQHPLQAVLTLYGDVVARDWRPDRHSGLRLSAATLGFRTSSMSGSWAAPGRCARTV